MAGRALMGVLVTARGDGTKVTGNVGTMCSLKKSELGQPEMRWKVHSSLHVVARDG